MSTHQIKAELLKFGERRTLKSLIRAKVGRLTVREAREWMNPTGSRLWLNAIGCAAMVVALGLLFVPFLFFAPLVLSGFLYTATRDRERWLTLLPPSRDDDLLEVVW